MAERKKTINNFLLIILLTVIIRKYIGLKKTKPNNIFLFIKSEQKYPNIVKKIDDIQSKPANPKKYSNLWFLFIFL